MKITRRFTKAGQDALQSVEYEKRTSRITNPDGSVVFEMNDAEIPKHWSQLATDIMVSKYFRKAGVPQADAAGNPIRDAQGNVVTGPERSAKEVVNRLAGCWRYWGEKHGYFDTAEDAQAFYDELAYMLLHQMCAPNSPQWFNTGLNFAYGITGPAQGHFYCDPRTGELLKSKDAYSHPQPHACQPYGAPVSTPNGPIPIGKIVKEKMIGLEVLDGREEGNGVTKVVAVKENGNKPVFRLLLEDGVSVEATGDHLVYALTSDGLTGRWVRLDSLERGAELLQAVRDREAERAFANGPLAASFGADAAAEVQTAVATMRKLRPVRVRRIEPLGVQAVYDIQTESNQYLSNHVIVHNCFIQSVSDDLVNAGGIMDLWTREARLFKYGSGTGSNFSRLRGENEPLSGGGKSSGLMSFLKIGDRAAGAIKSGGTTRRAAKMVCLDLDHPDVEQFVNWKVREEIKVAALAEGIKQLPKDQQELAQKLKLKLDYDFNGEAYFTVSGQNSNNSVRIPNRFFKAVEEDGNWNLTWRTNGKVAKSLKARDLWEQIAFAAWRCADPGVQYDDTINQWHTCPKSGRINASNPCVTGDTRVLTPGGIWRRIDQMIHLPSRVVTNLRDQEIHTTDGAFPTGTKEVYELRTAGGYAVKLTADHKVWTRTRGWVEAKDLLCSDEIKLPSKAAAVQEIGEPQDPRFFQLLGLFFSAANGNGDALRLDASLAGTHLAEPFARYVAENWTDRAYADDYVNAAMTDGGADDDADRSDAGTAIATLSNRRLMSRLKAYVRVENGQKRLSDEAFTAGLAAQKHLLRGLFTADAFVSNGSVELYSDSPGLLEDVQLILLGFGVQSSVFNADTGALSGGAPDRQGSPVPLGQRATAPSASFADGTPTQRGDAVSRHGLRIDPGSLRSFGKHVAMLAGAKLEQLATAVSYAIARGEQNGNFDRVATLTPLGKRQVFDLTEPATHSFVANGLTVHNCSEYMFLDDTACFAPETRISTPHGLRTVAELFAMQERREPVLITTDLHSEHDHRRVTAHRPAVVTRVGERQVFVMTLKDGRSIRTTADHRFLTDGGQWKRLDELEVGRDRVQIRAGGNPVSFTSSQADAERWQMLGWLTGDGVFSSDVVALVFGPQEGGTAREMAARFNHLLADAAAFAKSPAAPRTCSLSTQENGVQQISSKAQSLVEYLQEKYGFRQGTAVHKDAPAAVHGVPEDLKVAYLQGLFSADGCIRKSATENEVMLASSAPQLLRTVQLLLSDLGIASRITWCHPAGRANPQGQLHLYNQQARKFLALVGFPCSESKRAQAAAILARPFEGALKNPRPSTVISVTPDEVTTVYDITEPATHSVIAEGLIAHNCNLASLNVLTFFDPETRRFDIDGFQHGIRLWTIVLEVSVLMASFPSEEIAKLSYKYRTLGLGYANLGAMLMQAGIPYDSEKGRGICAALTAVLTGESYATSAEMAKELGAFPGYEQNKEEMLRVMRNHRRAAYDVDHHPAHRRGLGEYEALDIKPVGIDATQFSNHDPLASEHLYKAATDSWDRAVSLGEKHGYRNAQTTVIAPTGCLVGRSLVATDRGLMRLDHLGDVNGPRWQDVSFDVLTDAGDQRATKFFVNGVEATRRVTTRCGYAIEGTLKHRVKVIDTETGQWVWKRFADIQPGEVVPLAMGQMVGDPRPVELPPLGELYWTTDYTTTVPRAVTPELAEFVGYFMGDGSLHAKGLRLCVADTDPDVIDRLKSLAKSLFNIDAITTQKEGYAEVSVHSVGLTIWWEACGFTKRAPSPDHAGKGYLPRIPASVLATNDPVVYGAFLRGLFEADGTVLNGVPSWSTASGAFSDEVKSLMLALGLPTSTKHDVSGWGQGTLYVLRIRNMSYLAAFRRKVGFMGARKRTLVREAAPGEQAARYDYVYLPPELVTELVPAGSPLENAVVLARKRHNGAITRRAAETLLEQTADPRLAQALGFFYDVVQANDDAGEQMTYDLSVPANVTYVANGFVSHNTIGLLMDCDTTGVEPDFALVKFKKLAGGGYFKIANQSLKPALVNLGYTPDQVHDVLQYVMGTLTLHDAPGVSYERLLQKGFTRDELDKIDHSLPSQFELAFAFSPWSVGAETLKRLNVDEATWQKPGFNLLRHLGFTKRQIAEASDTICGRGTVEGAPHLKPEHYPVFDCANRCGKTGKRFIPVEGHIRMMAAAQPFISGAISKTINLPNEATVEDIKQSYHLSWKLGLKANALYRDGSKLSQPLNIKSDEELDKTEDDDDENVSAAKAEVANEVARAANALSVEAPTTNYQLTTTNLSSDNLAPAHTHIIEKIVERIVERPLRRRLPDTRNATTHKFDVSGHEGYITVGLYEDGSPGEIFVRMAKEGSTIGGLMDTIATLVSVSLQYGVPVESLVRKFEHVRFEPSGMTRNPEIPFAKSLVDYIFRWLAMEFVPGYRAANAPQRTKKPAPVLPVPSPGTPGEGQGEGGSLERKSAPGAQGPAPASAKKGNGHGPRLDPDTAKPFAYTDAELKDAHSPHLQAPEVGTPTPSGAALRLAIVADPLSQQSSELQADAPACDVCGSITVRSGTCYKCLNCGNSMGCS